MILFYCTEDGTGPIVPIDWTAHAEEVGEEQANIERVACSSHLVRNGNPPHTEKLSSQDVIELLQRSKLSIVLSGEPDSHGGRLASLLGDGDPIPLLCTDCDAPVRAIEG